MSFYDGTSQQIFSSGRADQSQAGAVIGKEATAISRETGVFGGFGALDDAPVLFRHDYRGVLFFF